MRTKDFSESGIVLISTMFMLVLFLALFGAYQASTQLDTATTKYSKDTTTGFYSAEAGLNIRAEAIRSIFVGFNRPTGTSPTSTAPCSGGNIGTGHYACQTLTRNRRDIKSYVLEDPTNPVLITIPRGERYQNLTAQEYRYTARSNAVDSTNDTEAQLELRFKTRLVPLFQFAAFYNKDLEILPGPYMILSGPVHTNGDLYLYSASNRLEINGQVTTAGQLYRGRKDASSTPSCNNNLVNIMDPNAFRSLLPSCSTRTAITDAQLVPFNNMIQQRVDNLTVPGPEVFDATPGSVYFDRADLRIALVLQGAAGSETINRYEVRTAANTNDAAATTLLTTNAACAGSIAGRAVGGTIRMVNNREQTTIRMLDIDLLALLNCLRTTNWFGSGKQLSDSTDGGLVFHFTVRGVNSAGINNYGVRVRNASRIFSNTPGAPAVAGLTIVTDQAGYIMGNYNSVNKIPAAFMADSMNVLSSNWNDNNSGTVGASPGFAPTYNALSARVATDTTINLALLSGTDSTGGTVGAGTAVGGLEGVAGQGGNYNGGLENYPRFHENWSGRTLLYRGSFVSLNRPQHVIGAWARQSYSPPNRDWNYDTSFNNAANLPPITPRFVYLKQELFVRDFDQ
jgi:hypothetical protein